MLLTITYAQPPATDLGFLLHKNPARAQQFDLPFGQAHVFYPEATEEKCTAALLLQIDPIGLVRGRRGSGEGGLLTQYVNDRPYAASSFLSVAIAQVYRSAMAGRCKDRPELAETPVPLTAHLSALPCRGGSGFLERLFAPLGYAVSAQGYPLDKAFPEWGESAYYTVDLSGTVRLSELLTHLYVLIPVLDNEKHYYVGDDEVEKLLRVGEGWLASHPERETIVRRYLKHRKSLADDALARLVTEEAPDPDAAQEEHAAEEESIERPISLHTQRLDAVLAVLKKSGAKSVLDLGCGEGRLLQLLMKEHGFQKIAGMDVSHRALEIASDRLRLNRIPEMQRDRIALFQGSLIYRDERLSGFDAAALVEVIEHLDPPRLAAMERVVFEFARPATVVVTTPNREYNVKFEGLPEGAFRHKDHRFEWPRAEFTDWANRVADAFGYAVQFQPVGPEDPELGPPSQMGVFTQR
jgi:3' terminal RNA ribose 2'-O-methyltransferase Hen1